MIATLSLLLALTYGAQDPPGVTLEELRLLEELDLDADLVERGLAAVQPGGALATSGEALALVARSLADIGEEARAATLLDSSRPSADGSAWVVAERVRLALARDDFDQALAHLGKARPGGFTLTHPEHPESWLLAGRTFARAGARANARPFFERFLELAPLHPEAPSAWHQLALDAVDRRDLERAAQCRAEKDRREKWHQIVAARRWQIRRQPDAPEPRFGLALAWMEVERFDRAEELLDDLAARAPEWCNVWFHLGEARRRLGGTETALAAFDRGVACDAGDTKSRFQRAEIRWQSGEREAAQDDFEALLATAVADDPRFAALHLRLAQAARAVGDEAAAQTHYARYRALGGETALDE